MRRSPDPRDRRALRALEHELAREGGRHPSPETIAQLLEPNELGAAEREDEAHVVRCRRCYALYAEMVYAEIGARMEATPSDLPEDFVQQALAIAREPSGRARTQRVGGFSAWRSPAWAVAAVGLLLLLDVPWRAGRGDVPPALWEEVMAIRGAALPAGWLLDDSIPVTSDVVYRDGGRPADLDALIERLVGRYESSRPYNPMVAELLVLACMADRRHDTAAVFLREAQDDYPRHPRLALLQAALDMHRGRDEAADSTLQSWTIASQQATVFRVNRALLHQAVGDRATALALLREVEVSSDGSTLSKYLRAELHAE